MKEKIASAIASGKLKARSIMFTALVLLGILQIFAGMFFDMVLYIIAVAIVMFFTKVGRL